MKRILFQTFTFFRYNEFRIMSENGQRRQYKRRLFDVI